MAPKNKTESLKYTALIISSIFFIFTVFVFLQPDLFLSLLKNKEHSKQVFKQQTPPTKIERELSIKSSEKLIQNIRAFPILEATLNIDGGIEDIPVITNPNSKLLVVNKERRLPDGFVPDDLVKPNVPFSFSGEDEKMYLRKEATEALEEMFEAAEKEGIHLFAVSGFRSYERQKYLFQYYVNTMGLEEAARASAFPGTSEHQTGWTMDITSASNNFQLTQSFGETLEGKWVEENAHRFGFIIRYPKDKEDITGYKYEPWHLRYVGVDAATYLKENNLTLEEVSGKRF